jgi:hypothetical protein
MQDLDAKIARLNDEKLQSARIQKYIAQLNQQIAETEKEIESLKDHSVEEAEDVQKLQGKDLNSVFQKFLGHDEAALEQEKQEALWAYMKLEKALNALKLLKYEKSILVKKLLSFSYEEKKLQALIKQKEKHLMQFPQMRIKLKLIDHNILRSKTEDREITEALEVIQALIQLFDELKKELGLINNWNQAVRNFYGKGNYSSYRKKEYIKRNLDLIPKIEMLNKKLASELEDLKKNYELDFTNNLILINNFFVLFLDNLITDWIVRNGIINSLKTVEVSLSKLNHMAMVLKYEQEEVHRTLKKYLSEREEVLLKERGES